MDGLIGSYGDVSDDEDDEAMEYESAMNEDNEENNNENEEELVDSMLNEIESSPPDSNRTSPQGDSRPSSPPDSPNESPPQQLPNDSSQNSTHNSLHDSPPDSPRDSMHEASPPTSTAISFNSALPGLRSYTSVSPNRSINTALTSLVSSYDDLDKTANDEKDEEDIEKQYDVTVENSDSESDSENFMGKLDEQGNVKIPSEPKGKCSSKLQEKIATELQKRRKFGYDPCSRMRENKQFRNPSIYDKLIEKFGINETGTNFTDPILNKSSWRTDSFYKQLAERQQKEYDKRETERKKEQANDPNSKIKQMVIADKEKRSKWDEKSGNTRDSGNLTSKDKLDKQLKAQLIQDKLNKQLMGKSS